MHAQSDPVRACAGGVTFILNRTTLADVTTSWMAAQAQIWILFIKNDVYAVDDVMKDYKRIRNKTRRAYPCATNNAVQIWDTLHLHPQVLYLLRSKKHTRANGEYTCLTREVATVKALIAFPLLVTSDQRTILLQRHEQAQEAQLETL